MNNIALVKLREDVKLGKFVQTVCLPEDDEGDLAMTKTHGTHAANCWGNLKHFTYGIPKWANRVTNRLQNYTFLIQKNRLCSNGTVSFNSTVSFCAGKERGSYPCFGNHGSVFVQKGKRGNGYRWVATGVASFGNVFAHKHKLTFYTRVFPFIDWIKKTMCRKYSILPTNKY